jgi:hypothetical protein
MWTKTTTLILSVFLIVFVGYVGIHRLTFKMPTDTASAEAGGFVGEECGFTPADFSSGHQMTVNEAWWISFTRKQDYYSAFSMALSLAFVTYVLSKARLIGVKTAAGSLGGGGLLAGTALCLS